MAEHDDDAFDNEIVTPRTEEQGAMLCALKIEEEHGDQGPVHIAEMIGQFALRHRRPLSSSRPLACLVQLLSAAAVLVTDRTWIRTVMVSAASPTARGDINSADPRLSAAPGTNGAASALAAHADRHLQREWDQRSPAGPAALAGTGAA